MKITYEDVLETVSAEKVWFFETGNWMKMIDGVSAFFFDDYDLRDASCSSFLSRRTPIAHGTFVKEIETHIIKLIRNQQKSFNYS